MEPRTLAFRLFQYPAEDSERETAHGAEPQPYLGEEDMQSRAINYAINLITRNMLGAANITIAKEGYAITLYHDDTMYYEVISSIRHYNIILANILLTRRSQGNGRATAKEWQHTLAFDGNSHGFAFE